MTITVDWPNREVNIEKSDLTLVQSSPTEVYELNLDSFRLTLKSLEYSVQGMNFLDIHKSNAPVSVGGVSLARVLEIINGYTITFEDGQYAVNLVGANSNVGDRVNVNQVSIRTANSAGLTYSKEVEDQSFFDSRVYINTLEGLSGTEFPRGTPGNPVSNLLDAEQIIGRRGLSKRLFLIGSIGLNEGESLVGYNLKGDFYANSYISLANGSSSNNSVFANCTFNGGFHDSNCQYTDCLIINATNLEGYVSKCKIGGLIAISGDCDIVNCYGSGVITSNPSTENINIVNFSGDITIGNITNPDAEIYIGILSGIVTIDASCTAGRITVVDSDLLVDNSGSGCVVVEINQHTITQSSLSTVDQKIDLLPSEGAVDLIRGYIEDILRYHDNDTRFLGIDGLTEVTQPDCYYMVLYEDDGVTELKRISFRNSSNQPVAMPLATRYARL